MFSLQFLVISYENKESESKDLYDYKTCSGLFKWLLFTFYIKFMIVLENF